MYLIIIKDNFAINFDNIAYFLIKMYVVSAHENSLEDVVLVSIHNIDFNGEIYHQICTLSETFFVETQIE